MIYRLVYQSLTNDFIVIDERTFAKIRSACRMSQFQRISTELMDVCSSDEEGGLDFPDFYYDEAVPLFDVRLFEAMKDCGVDNLFEKRVSVTCKLSGEKHDYILGLPPRIDAIRENIHGKPEIDSSRLANYLIFKLSGVPDNNIYITEELKQLFDKYKPWGLGVVDVLDYDSRA